MLRTGAAAPRAGAGRGGNASAFPDEYELRGAPPSGGGGPRDDRPEGGGRRQFVRLIRMLLEKNGLLFSNGIIPWRSENES